MAYKRTDNKDIMGQEKREAPKLELLSDEDMKGMMKLLVDDTDDPESDHKCGSCSMRIPGKGDEARCTVVGVPISLSRGTCIYWAKGDASKEGDVHPSRMSAELSGYVETESAKEKVQCGWCRFYETKESETPAGFCSLWKGDVKKGWCCTAFDHAGMKAPETQETT